MACEPHSARASCAPLVEGTGPRVEGRWGVGELPHFLGSSGDGLSAESLCGVSPSDAHEGREGFVRERRPVSPPGGGERREKEQACARSPQAGEGAGSAAAPADALTNARALADARGCAKASRAVAWRGVLRGDMCRLALPAPCQVCTVALQAGQSTYKGPGADCLQRPLLRRSRFPPQLRPSVGLLQ